MIVDTSDKKQMVYRFGGWERLVIFSGVVLTVPLVTLFAAAVYALIVDRPHAIAGILLSFILVILLWAMIWGVLWIVSGYTANGRPPLTKQAEHEELLRENARLKALLEEKSSAEKQ
jgi:hypothetical protein